ncbi:phosphoglycolate phosphatase-like HAD superfamily hydrolase [Lipingzhangella halophila]|uniref:Phosphoglycolate phosphatase-like HAD superfamily hydrolase n=1 Tax=Lipingzhangella halophila TaxID=1783352 RepID=A0A7W7REW3_9ACTN|nr:HAD family hydrolase [Lipingzhangella halophila]MBB4930727.1 phosphoglycolate phosphatase-like HAD superfamily hydrolase [Lipingzhangella halophila]
MAENALDRITGIAHIVWDWNGTLLDDNHATLAAINKVCAEFGRPPVGLEYWRSIFRRPLLSCYEELLGRRFADHEWDHLNEAYDRQYSAMLPSCGLAEGVPDVLHEWSTAGGTQSLLSMAAHQHLVPLVSERGLDGHFTRVDGRRFDNGQDSKTEHLLAHLAEQEVDPDTVVLIGDIDDDAYAAREAGAHAILVSTGMMSEERLRATGHPVAPTPAAAVAALTC